MERMTLSLQLYSFMSVLLLSPPANTPTSISLSLIYFSWLLHFLGRWWKVWVFLTEGFPCGLQNVVIRLSQAWEDKRAPLPVWVLDTLIRLHLACGTPGMASLKIKYRRTNKIMLLLKTHTDHGFHKTLRRLICICLIAANRKKWAIVYAQLSSSRFCAD